MKKFFLAMVSISLVTACVASTEDQQQSMSEVQSKLPDGCSVSYAGDVEIKGSYYSSRIFYVTCGNTVTTSESHEVSQGKTTKTDNNITVLKTE